MKNFLQILFLFIIFSASGYLIRQILNIPMVFIIWLFNIKDLEVQTVFDNITNLISMALALWFIVYIVSGSTVR